MDARELITEHMEVWTGAVTHKSGTGRGNNGQPELTGIKKLRELILELAVRGKLVEQDPDDEPASVLLERIEKERTNLLDKAKIKKDKVNSSRPEGFLAEHMPPEWKGVRLGEVISLVSGQHLKGDEYSKESSAGAIPYLTGPAEFGVSYPKPTRFTYQRRAVASPGDILITCKGSGVGSLNWVNEETAISRQLMAIQPIIVNRKFIFIVMETLRNSIRENVVGIAIPGISRRDICDAVIGLPSLQEQHRIVEKVDELMALCDRLEHQVGDQLEAHEVLVDTLLDALTRSTDAKETAEHWARVADQFDTLFTTEASIDKLKQTILQLGVMGCLVPQDPNDEPADQLVNRLANERDRWLCQNSEKDPESRSMIRKLGKLSAVAAPFELPLGWTACNLIQLSRMMVDCHNKTAPYQESRIPIIRTSNIRDREFVFNDLKYVSEETYRYWSRRCPPEPGDIIFTREAPMGEAAIIPEGARWCLGQRTMLIRPMHGYVNPEYLLLSLTEPRLLKRASGQAIGSTVKHLRVGDVERFAVAVPPVEEQHRIVEKVDELMALCDQVKARLGEAGETRTQLAEAVVEKAVS